MADRNFAVATVSSTAKVPARVWKSPRSSTPALRHSRHLAAAAAAVGRTAGRAHPPRQPRRLRGARPALPVAAAGLLPPHARLARGRRGRAAGGLRRRLQRDPGRRARRSTCGRGCTASPATAASTTCAARSRSAWTRWTSTSPSGGIDHRRQGRTSARTSACSSPTSRICPRRSAPRCCYARSTRSPTTRSPRRWRPRSRRSSRCSSAPASRSPRPPRRASSPARRSASSSAR